MKITKELADQIRFGRASDEDLKGCDRDEVLAIKGDPESIQYRFHLSGAGGGMQALERDLEQKARKKKVDPEARTVHGDVISTQHVDHASDIVEQKGLDRRTYSKNNQVLWCHQSRELPVGMGVRLRRGKTADGVEATFADTEFLDADLNPFAELVRRNVVAGGMPGRSIGFMSRKMRFPEEEERTKLGMFSPWGAIHERSTLLEYSVCPVPMNANALQQERCLKMFGQVADHALREGTLPASAIREFQRNAIITEKQLVDLRRERTRGFVDFGQVKSEIEDIVALATEHESDELLDLETLDVDAGFEVPFVETPEEVAKAEGDDVEEDDAHLDESDVSDEEIDDLLDEDLDDDPADDDDDEEKDINPADFVERTLRAIESLAKANETLVAMLLEERGQSDLDRVEDVEDDGVVLEHSSDTVSSRNSDPSAIYEDDIDFGEAKDIADELATRLGLATEDEIE